MPHWSLIVEPVVHGNALEVVEVLDEVNGTREEAEARLREHVRRYTPRHPMNPRRTRVYRTDDGYLMLVDGSFNKTYPHRFRICQLEWDSGAM